MFVMGIIITVECNRVFVDVSRVLMENYKRIITIKVYNKIHTTSVKWLF